MKSMFGNEAPPKAAIYNWFKEFSRDRKNISDDVREDQPRNIGTP